LNFEISRNGALVSKDKESLAESGEASTRASSFRLTNE
jgi:hypothetical protein